MQGANETGMDGTSLGVLAVVGAIIVAWAKKADPRLFFVWLNAPLMEKHLVPLHARFDGMEKKLDKVTRVIDNMPGSSEAHAAVKAEDERWKA